MTAVLTVAAVLLGAWLNHELKQSDKRRQAAIELHLHEINPTKENS